MSVRGKDPIKADERDAARTSIGYMLVYGLPAETCVAKFEVLARLQRPTVVEIGVLAEQYTSDSGLLGASEKPYWHNEAGQRPWSGSRRRSRRRPRVKLYRPATVLVGMLFVLLGGLTRLAEPDQVYDDETNRVVVKGTIGEALDYSGSTVTVHRMKFARAYLTGDRGRQGGRRPTASTSRSSTPPSRGTEDVAQPERSADHRRRHHLRPDRRDLGQPDRLRRARLRDRRRRRVRGQSRPT